MAENNFGFAPKQCLEEDNHEAHPHKWKDLLYWCEGVDESLARILTDSRKELYGDPVDNMHGVAVMWNAYLQGRKIQAWDVPIMHILNKIHRLGTSPDYGDHSDDVDGYMDLFRQVIEATHPQGMIKARTTDEYWEKKHPAQTQQEDKINDASKEFYDSIGATPVRHGICNEELTDGGRCTRMAGHVGPHDASRQDPAKGRGIVPPYIERKVEDHIANLNQQIMKSAPEGMYYASPDTQAPIDWQEPMDLLNNLSIRPSDD
jgi:hypothetical protein